MAPHRLVLLVLLGALAACADEPRRDNVWTGASEVVFIDDGAETIQIQPVECRWTSGGMTWGMARLMQVTAEPHWRLRPDGSLILMDDIMPCVGRQQPEGDGDVVPDPDDQRTDEVGDIGSRHGTWLFDSADHPTRADLLSTAALMTGDGPLRIGRITRGSQASAAPSPLAQGFPGLRDATTMSNGAGRQVVDLLWLGVQAAVWRVRADATCGATPDASCADIVRYLRMEPSADFSRLEVDTAPTDPAYRLTLFSPEPMLALKMAIWAPEVCVGDLCQPTSAEDAYEPSDILFDGPAEDEIIVVTFRSETVGLPRFMPR